jgi:hypothetical protein
MLQTLDTVIAFAVIMTVLSLIITIIVQMVSAGFSLRGKNLANALSLTFQTIDPKIGEQAHSLAAQILRDPIFSDSLMRRKNRPAPADKDPQTQQVIAAERVVRQAQQNLARRRAEAARQPAPFGADAEVETAQQSLQMAEQALATLKANWKAPVVKENRMKEWSFLSIRGAAALGSAIRPGEIYRILHEFDDLTETEAALRQIPKGLAKVAGDVLRTLHHPDHPAAESQQKLAVINAVAARFATPAQQEAVVKALDNLGATVERATTQAYDRFQRWFGSAQDRAEQWFQTHARIVTIMFAIAVAFLLQLDTIEMFRQLRARPRTVEALTQAASGVVEQGRNILDPGNTAARQSYLLWLKKRPQFTLEKMPISGTDAGYRQAIQARLQDDVTKGSLKPQEMAPLLADYDALKDEGVQEFLKAGKENVRQLQETLADADFPLAPASFLGRWDDPKHGRDFWSRVGLFWPHLFGVLITAGLLTLGAPFWFNLLKNLMSLRPAVANLIEKRPTSAPALPAMPEKPPSSS